MKSGGDSPSSGSIGTERGSSVFIGENNQKRVGKNRGGKGRGTSSENFSTVLTEQILGDYRRVT